MHGEKVKKETFQHKAREKCTEITKPLTALY